MRRYLTYTFPAGNTTDLCKLQSTGAAGNLILNGNLTNQIGTGVNFLSLGYSRSVSLTSANNLSGLNVTIVGTQNGEKITEVIAGPNNQTKYGVEIFDVITSVSVSAAANGISIGTGHSGYFPVININLQRAVINYSLSIFRLTAASIPTVIVNTLDDFQQNGQKFSSLGENIFPVKALAADDQYLLPVANVIPCYAYLISIEGDNTTIANSIRMNFIQV